MRQSIQATADNASEVHRQRAHDGRRKLERAPAAYTAATHVFGIYMQELQDLQERIMLSYSAFSQFVHTLRDEPILSVYLSSAWHDPAEKTAWRVQLAHALQGVRTSLAEVRGDERDRFEHCVRRLQFELDSSPDLRAAPGWVAFITPGVVCRTEPLSIPVATAVHWGKGPYVTPYLRAMAEDHFAIVVVMDAVETRVYRYGDGVLTRARTLGARLHLHPPLHMGDIPHQGFHPGVRGESGREGMQRDQSAATDRMLREAADVVARLAGDDGWILAGGIPRVANQLLCQLPDSVHSRVLQLDTLDVHATNANIIHLAREGISVLRNLTAARELRALIAAGNHDRRVTLSAAATYQGLEQSRVHELYITDEYLASHPDDAERTLRLAIDQRTVIHIIMGPSAPPLDQLGGMVARLRYPLRSDVWRQARPASSPSTDEVRSTSNRS